jgi:hypothetical protein
VVGAGPVAAATRTTARPGGVPTGMGARGRQGRGRREGKESSASGKERREGSPAAGEGGGRRGGRRWLGEGEDLGG